MSQEDQHTVQPKEARRTAFNCQVRPLALRFHSQMRPALFKGHFDGPAFDEVCHDFCGTLRLIDREVGFGFPLALRITGEHPANGQLRLVGTYPDSEGHTKLLVWSLSTYDEATHLVHASQFYEQYNSNGILQEKRLLQITFVLLRREEFETLATSVGSHAPLLIKNVIY